MMQPMNLPRIEVLPFLPIWRPTSERLTYGFPEGQPPAAGVKEEALADWENLWIDIGGEG